MKAVGQWVVMQKVENESLGGIISSSENVGLVLDCAVDESIIGKKVCFDSQSGRFHLDYLFVEYDKIYGLMEEEA
jgi:hypothetical protein